MASARFSPWKTLDQRLNEGEMLRQSLPQVKINFPRLSMVKSCAMIGCGYGHLDLEFVCGCLPNVTELTAVEPDEDQMKELKTRVAQLLPTVATNFYQATAQEWNGGEKVFDAVLLFHFLYYVPLSERRTLFKQLFDNVVASGGLVVVLIQPTNLDNSCGLIRLWNFLNLLSNNWMEHIDEAQICDMMTSVGFQDCYQLSMKGHMDVEVNDDFIELFVFWSRGRLSQDQVRDAVKELFGSEKIVPNEMWLGVFRKP